MMMIIAVSHWWPELCCCYLKLLIMSLASPIMLRQMTVFDAWATILHSHLTEDWQ